MTAWALAPLSLKDRPLFESIAAASIRTLRAEEDDTNAEARRAELAVSAHALLCIAWTPGLGASMPVLPLLDLALNHARRDDPFMVGLLCMGFEWARDTVSRDELMRERIDVAIVLPTERRGCLKLSRLLDAISTFAAEGVAASELLRGVESFAAEASGQWLKVAGGRKAEVLAATASCYRRWGVGPALEYGAFIGYTTLRLGMTPPMSLPCPRVSAMESDAMHVAVARALLDIARARLAAEVWSAPLPLAAPRLAEELGSASISMVFLDHKGTRFHEDLHAAGELGLLRRVPDGCLLADNTLSPGAPLLAWHCTTAVTPACGGGLAWVAASFWSLSEFHRDHEDWVAALTHGGGPSPSAW